MKIITIAEVPDELRNDWCQWVRVFDVAHSGCKFSMLVEAPNKTTGEIKEILKIMPELSIIK